jgi:hypothetical protein
MTDAYKRLAENDGARFYKESDSDRWTAEDRDGIAIVSGAMSLAEAARFYCEDKGLPSSEEILDRIVATYGPFYVLEEFWQGFRACQRDSVLLCNPYQDESVKAKAWDRGASVAVQYQQTLSRAASTAAEVDEAEPDRLLRVLRTRRR